MPTLKWGSEFLVNTTTAGNQDQSNVTALADGGFVVTWRDAGVAVNIIRWQRYDATGVKVGAENILSFNDGGNQSLPKVVQLSDGNLWFVNQDFDSATDNDIEGVVLTLDGALVRHQEPNTSSTVDHQDPAIASLGSNGSVAVYYDATNGGGDIMMRGFNADGSQKFAQTTVNTNAGSLAAKQHEPWVAASLDGSKFVVTWYDDGLNGGDVRARVYNADGTPAGAEFTINSAATFEVGNIHTTGVVWLDANRFVVTWEGFAFGGNGFDTKYAMYNADGSLFKAESLANSTLFEEQGFPAICRLPNGGFVIAWDDFSGTGADNSGTAIRLQAFDGSGNKTGGEILVNTTTSADQGFSSLAALTDGRVIVTWTDWSGSGGDTSGLAIRSQIVDPRDGVIDGTAGADTLYGHDAVGDVISAGNGDDTLWGLAGNDVMYGSSGLDTLNGGLGDDTLYGDDGNDTLNGDDGNDRLYGGDGGDAINGGDGNDTVFVSGATIALDTIDGGAGADTLDLSGLTFGTWMDLGFGNPELWNFSGGVWYQLADLASVENFVGTNSDDWMRLDDADNVATGGGGNDLIYGMGGNDRLSGGDGNDKLFGGSGNDVMTAGNGTDEMYGESGNDTFKFVGGTANGTDWAQGDAGTDTADFSAVTNKMWIDLTFSNVEAWTYNTVGGGTSAMSYLRGIENIIGTGQSDQIYGDGNGNGISGGNGDDFIVGRGGNDVLSGDAGYDRLFGDDGNDTLSGGLGVDELYGGNNDDTFLFSGGGNTGVDYVDGGSGNDTADFSGLSGIAWADLGLSANQAWTNYSNTWTIIGQLANVDNLTGTSLNDQFWGDGNANIFIGGAGNDQFTGRGGIDTFKYNATGFGQDIVADFVDGVDRLSFTSAVATGLAAFTITGQGSTQVILTLNSDPTSTITLNGAAPITINAADIDFVV